MTWSSAAATPTGITGISPGSPTTTPGASTSQCPGRVLRRKHWIHQHVRLGERLKLGRRRECPATARECSGLQEIRRLVVHHGGGAQDAPDPGRQPRREQPDHHWRPAPTARGHAVGNGMWSSASSRDEDDHQQQCQQEKRSVGGHSDRGPVSSRAMNCMLRSKMSDAGHG
jgi:hypothetical protein